MYLDAVIKQTKDETHIHLKGSFLVLVRPEGSDDAHNDIRAMVRQVHLKSLDGGMFSGRVRVGNYDIDLIGTYGNDGCAVEVMDGAYQTGFPIPDILYQYYKAVPYRTIIKIEADEFRTWGRALLRHQQRRLEKGCYRCHNKDAETELLTPCGVCQDYMQVQLDYLLDHPPLNETEQKKPSVASAEAVGTPTIGVQPL
jgi:hypothetical protein